MTKTTGLKLVFISSSKLTSPVTKKQQPLSPCRVREYNYRIFSIRRRGYYFFAVCFSAAIQEWLLFEGDVYFVGKPAAIISTRVYIYVRRENFRGLRLFRSELPIVRLVFEDGAYSTEATI